MLISRTSLPRAAWLAFALLAACAAPPPAKVADDLNFDQGVAAATDNLFAQTQKGLLSKVEAVVSKKGVVIDPLIDAASGQQTNATRAAEKKIAERVKAGFTQFDLLPFAPASMAKAQLLLTGTLTRQAGDPNRYQLNLALTDVKTGLVAAQSSAMIRDAAIDSTPTPYFRDSPVLVRDPIVDGYIKTAETAPGSVANKTYLERTATGILINDALAAYDSERYADALQLYKSALDSPGGEQLRVYNGLYLANWRLGKNADAEQAFGKVVSTGLANKNLGVKFLFNAGTTDFWSDPKVSGPYAIWLRQIARQAAAAKACMNIVGHTSHTGSEQMNDRLSERRAAYIKQRLDSEAPELASRTRAAGMGFRENLVGTGTDDARDALDRRVEFRVVGC